MKIITLLFLLLIFSSCEKTIYMPIPEESNKPVLNLLMNKDSVMVARVTLSSRLNGSGEMQEIKNAVVNLYENGNLKETLTPIEYNGATFYRSTTLAQEGVTYKVTAAVPGYPEVSGSDQVPPIAAVGKLDLTVTQTDVWQTKVTVSVQIHDYPDAQNYYRIRIYDLSEWSDGNGNSWRGKAPLYFKMEDGELPIFNDGSGSDFFTTDALFNGHSPRFTFNVTTYDTFKKMIVEVSTLTYHSYNYLNSAYMAREKNEDGFSEKVVVYNNIVNGLGIVGGVAQREYELVR